MLRGEKERVGKSYSSPQHSQGIPCQTEHGLLAEPSVRCASLTDDSGPCDISPRCKRGQEWETLKTGQERGG